MLIKTNDIKLFFLFIVLDIILFLFIWVVLS